MSTDAFEQLIDVAAPGGGSYPVQRGHRRGVRSPHTFDAARWPPSSLTSPYAPQGSTTAVLGSTNTHERIHRLWWAGVQESRCSQGLLQGVLGTASSAHALHLAAHHHREHLASSDYMK